MTLTNEQYTRSVALSIAVESESDTEEDGEMKERCEEKEPRSLAPNRFRSGQNQSNTQPTPTPNFALSSVTTAFFRPISIPFNYIHIYHIRSHSFIHIPFP